MLTVVGVIAEMRLTDVADDPGVRTNGTCYYPYRQGGVILVAGALPGLAAAALVAIAIPARRAARTDPTVALSDS
jgi:hypothetical protein